jgi:hypothetical protein
MSVVEANWVADCGGGNRGVGCCCGDLVGELGRNQWWASGVAGLLVGEVELDPNESRSICS